MAYREIQEQFRRVLGRDPRPDEFDYFNKQGDLSPYQVGQVLESTPEYQQSLLKSQGQIYGETLGQADQYALGRAQEDITGQFRSMGRPDSSGVSGAFASAAADLAARRQNQLASFYGGGLQNIGSAYSQQGQAQQQRAYGLSDERRNRAWQLEDYYRQKDDYAGMMRQQSKANLRNQLIGGGIGLLGSLGGAYAGGLGMAAGLGSYGAGSAASSSGYMGGGGLNLPRY